MNNDRRIRISQSGMGIVSFDPLGLKDTNFNIYIPSNFFEEGTTLSITFQTPNGEVTKTIQELSKIWRWKANPSNPAFLLLLNKSQDYNRVSLKFKRNASIQS